MVPAFLRNCRPLRSISLASIGRLLFVMGFLGTGSIKAQDNHSARAKSKTQPGAQKAVIAGNLKEELAKFKPVWMPFDASHLSVRERQMMNKLVVACQNLESIYWRQSDPEGLNLFKTLLGSHAPADVALRRFLRINGSRFDLINNDAPFVGVAPRPPGRGFFPADL